MAVLLPVDGCRRERVGETAPEEGSGAGCHDRVLRLLREMVLDSCREGGREGVREGVRGREKKRSLCGPLVVHYVVHITSTERERRERERIERGRERVTSKEEGNCVHTSYEVALCTHTHSNTLTLPVTHFKTSTMKYRHIHFHVCTHYRLYHLLRLNEWAVIHVNVTS